MLVGHSMGAAAAIAYAGAHNDRVAGLVVEGIGGKLNDKVARPMLEAIDADYEGMMNEFWSRLLADATPETEAQVKRDRAVLTKKQSLAMIHATFAYDPVPDLGQFEGPKLTIITPDGDTSVALHRLTPGLPVQLIEGTSHWSHLDQPALFNALLDEFLAKPSVSGG